MLMLMVSNLAIAEECDYSKSLLSHDSNLLEIKLGKLTESLVQFDIKAPRKIGGQEIASAQIIQMDKNLPFFLVPISFPFGNKQEVETQIFSEPAMFNGGDIQIFYKGVPCNKILSKKIHITKLSN